MTDPEVPPPAPVPIGQLVPGIEVDRREVDGELVVSRAAVDPSTGWPSAYVFRYRMVEQLIPVGQIVDQGAELVRAVPALGSLLVLVPIPL